LDETYERVLRDIHEDNQEHTRRLLHCLAVSVRPLRVEELAEILAFDFDTAEGDIPEYHADWRWKDQEEAVLSTCSSLITIADYNDHYGSRWRVVQFSHFSVKEFLMSDRLATPTRDVSRHRILPRPAHTILVQACLGFLLHSDGHMTHIDAERAKAFPLAKYAAEHWVTHAKFQDVASYVKYGMKDLFDPEMPYFASWVGTHNIDELVGSFGKCTLPTPLYYSALCGFHDIAKDLSVKYPHHVNAIGGGYDSPLGAALSQGHVRVAELLLEHGGDLEVRGPRGHTPLHTLLLHNDHDNKDSFMDGVQLLLKRGSNANTRDEGHQTPLHTLLRPENLAWSRDHNPDDYILVVAQLLLEHGADVNARCNVHTTPLLLATQHGAFNIACCLLEHGADPNLVYEEDKTLLHLLFHHFSMIHTHAFARLLLKHGADMNPRDNVNNTPLLLAVQHNSFDDARFLLEHGADPNLVYNEGKTLLHLLLGAYDSSWGFFSGFGHYRNDCILSQAQLLIKHGADVDARDNVHKTPLLLAFQYSLLNVIQFFLKHGANPNLVYEEGKTLLHLLLGAHDDSGWGSVWGFGRRRDNRILFAARLLLEYGADVNARDDTHETPLFLAFQHDAPNVTLLELGVNPNLQSSEGNTPLYTPPLEHDNDNDNDVIILQLLLEHGADTSAINKNHVTPLDLAPYYGKVAIVQELLDHANESEGE
jgi:ankyrin repeat protein